jgi:uncharacterized membrane protein YfcA
MSRITIVILIYHRHKNIDLKQNFVYIIFMIIGREEGLYLPKALVGILNYALAL